MDDICEHGVHGSEVMQCASRIVELSLIVLSKSNLRHSKINGEIVERDTDTRTA